MKGIPIAELFKATEIRDYDLHPNGRTAICTVNRGRNWELATLDLRTGRVKRFLSSDESLTDASYSPSGDSTAYITDFQGDENHDIVVIGTDGKKAKKLTGGGSDNFNHRFSPDGRTIAFASNRDSDTENIFVVPSSGGKIAKLTREKMPVLMAFAWSPQGDRIAYQTGIGDEDTISVVNVRTGRTKKVLGKAGVDYWLSHYYGPPSPWSPDGKSLLYLSNEDDMLDIGAIDLQSMRSKWLVRSANEKAQPMWSPDGKALAYLEIEDPDILLKVKRGQSTRTVSPRDGVSRDAQWLPDGSGLVFLSGSATRPQEMFIWRGSGPKRVTRFQKKPLEKALVRPRLVAFKSFDGRRIPALLFEPKDRTRRAGVVAPHGGPEAQTLNEWDQLPQMLADKGFYVIEPNYRGSTGYGREFLHSHDKDLGGGDTADTVYAGKHLVESGLVDEDRLAYWGASYSGFTCMLALTKWPDMWAAGVSIVGFFDWETEMADERGYLKAYDTKKMGDPKKNPEFFKERSPINFLENLRAPLLMTASSQDVRCPPTESRAVVSRLKRIGKEHEYHEYPDEGHWPRKRKNLRDLYSRSTRFLDRHVPK
ncbi:MAG: hypothetical protein A3K67_06505 [Euryarchaeota archaeon RBG_16_62_10]|nr:MAG: hypothetical protein A3K67_06505 [Euryarchaeota archaeon RBG_16_62_10]